MPWKIVDGQPIRYSRQEVSVELPPPEISSDLETVYTCLICGKAYKTSRGLDNHLYTHEE